MVNTNTTISRFPGYAALSRVFRRETKSAPPTATKAAFEGPITSYSAWTADSYYDTRDLPRSEYGYGQVYMASAWANRALNIRAQKVGSVLWRKGRVVNKATGKPALEHPFYAALDMVFKYYKQDLFEEWQLAKCLYGEAYIELVPMELFEVVTALPLTFRLLNSLAVEPVILRGEVKEFRYSGDDETRSYSVDELVFDRQYNPANDIRGLSLLTSALDAVNIERGQTRIARAMINNNMRPGIIFTPKEGTVITKVDAKTIETTIKEQGKGAHNSGRPLFIPFPFDVTAVAPPTFEDQEYLSEQQKRKISAVIGIPVGMVDHTDGAFQLSPEQKRALYELTILPAAEKEARIVDAELLPFIDPSGQYRYELPSEEILAELEDPSLVVSVANSKLASGGISLNEYRTSLNMSALPPENGDIHFLPAGSLQVPSDQIGALQAKPSYMPYGNPSVTIQQAAELADGAGIHVPKPPPASTNPEGEAPVALTQGVTDTTAPPAPAPAIPAINPALVVDAGKKDEGVVSGALMLSLANDPDLMVLQNQVRKYAGTVNEWSDPSEFHITLAYMPGITDDQADELMGELENLTIPPLSLGIGSLRVFKNPGENAVHFRILRNVALLDFQKRLVETITALGIPISSYSLPDNYTPHITMGHSVDPVDGVAFRARGIKLTPSSLEFTVGDEVLWSSADTPISTDDDKPAEDELKTWRKFALKHGAEKAGRFVCNIIDDATAAGIRAQLAAVTTDDDKDAIKAVFEGVSVEGAQKAIQATRLNFEGDCADLLAAATSGSIERASFSNKMRALIRNYGRDAYRDGLTDGGIEEPGFDDDDVETINRMVNEQSKYVTSLGMVLFRGGGITANQEDNKPAMWYRKSIEPFYIAGLGAADRNGLYEWVLGDTEEHCVDCLRLNGQKHRMKDWLKRNLVPQSDSLECGGWHCDCKLVKTTGKTTGNF